MHVPKVNFLIIKYLESSRNIQAGMCATLMEASSGAEDEEAREKI